MPRRRGERSLDRNRYRPILAYRGVPHGRHLLLAPDVLRDPALRWRRLFGQAGGSVKVYSV